VGERGVEYQLVGSDGTYLYGDSVFYAPVVLPDLENPSPVAQKQWTLFSIPLRPRDNSVANLLAPLGKYDDTEWRLFGFSDNDSLYEYNGTSFDQLTPGQAYWTYVDDQALNLSTTEAVTINTLQPFERHLKPGWNLVGNPFCLNVDWQAVDGLLATQGNDTNIAGPYFFDASAASWISPASDNSIEAQRLRPWAGYAVYNYTDTDVLLRIPAVVHDAALSRSRMVRRHADSKGWMVKLRIGADDGRQHELYLGVTPGARAGWDRNDLPIPAQMEGSLFCYFDRQDRSYRPGRPRETPCPCGNCRRPCRSPALCAVYRCVRRWRPGR